MPTVHLILLVFAFVLFVLAGLGLPQIQRPPLHLGWLGLALLTLALWLH